MVCEKVIGKLKDVDIAGKTVEYVNIEWHEAFKKLHKKTSKNGVDVGIKLDNYILTEGLHQGDILNVDGDNVIAVNIPPDDALVITVHDEHLIPKVCYEIGNRHATLFSGNNHNEFITIYSEPMKEMLEKASMEMLKEYFYDARGYYPEDDFFTKEELVSIILKDMEGK